MSAQYKHIFDKSACPTKRQMNDYLAGKMVHEEIYAFEHHINSCMLCSEAIDGLQSQPNAISGLAVLDDNFLKDHLELHPPVVHLNAIAPAVHNPSSKKTAFVWKPIGIAAAIILLVGSLLYFNAAKQYEHQSIAQHQTPKPKQSTLSASALETETRENPENAFALLSSEKNKKINPLDALPKEEKNLLQKNTSDLPQAEHNNTTTPSQPILTDQTQTEETPTAPPAAKEETPEKTPPPETSAAALSEISHQKKTNNKTGTNKADTHKTTHLTDDENIADLYYKEGAYTKALAAYKKAINSKDAKQSQQAQLRAAKCYIQLGNKKEALNLLHNLAESGKGTYKRQAKRLLKDLENEGLELE